ncbi:MAG: cytochrome c [Vicinamibacterales bacterium]
MAVRLRSILLGLVALVIALVLAGITAVGWEIVLGPKFRTTTDQPFEVTEARLARGQYLVEGVAHCFHCHSEHDLSTPEYPIVAARRGAGWLLPIPELGTLAAPNITPDPDTGLGAWTDDEIARAIREGVRKDGRALFPVMPYTDFAKMSDEDVASIVVYLRTIPAVRNTVPARQLIFPLSLLVNTMPEPLAGPVPGPATATPVERGHYLATLAGCIGCHTPTDDQGIPLPHMELAGGAPFDDPGREMAPVFSANITRDPSGIAHYDEAMFKETLRTGRLPGRVLNHIMPFEAFSHLTDEDLSALFAYLEAQPPIKHRVSNTDPPTPCPICKRSHGLGNLNVLPQG